MLNYQVLLNALQRISFLCLFILHQKHLAHLTLSQFAYNIEILEVHLQIGVGGRLQSTTAQFPIFECVWTIKLFFPAALFLDVFKWNHEDQPCTFLDESLVGDEKSGIFIGGIRFVDDCSYLIVVYWSLQTNIQIFVVVSSSVYALLVLLHHNFTRSDELLLLWQTDRTEHARTTQSPLNNVVE